MCRLVTIRIGDREESLSWEQWEQRVADGRVPPTALVRFEPVTGEAFLPASELDLFHSLRDDARRAWSDRYRAGSPPWMTALIVGAQIRLWWLMRTGDLSDVRDTLQLWQPAVLEDGEVWRLLTAGLTHWSVGHIVSNLVMLAYIGWFLERALGRVNLLVIFVTSVLGGSVLSMSMTPGSGSLGASGGVLGVVAAATVFGFVRFGLLPERARIVFGWALLPYLIILYGMGWTSETTDNWAHTGGLVTGGLLALVLDPPGLERRKAWNLVFWLGSAGASAALLGGLWLAGVRLLTVEDVAARSPLGIDRSKHRELIWTAPTTWQAGRIEGAQGYRSPAYGRRGWAVRVRHRTRPTDPERELELWRDDLKADWEHQVTFGPAQPTTLAGFDGLHQQAFLDDGEGATLERWVATRGHFALEATWSVDDPVEARLASLRGRLLDDVVWNEPASLVRARDALERSPKSRPLRRALAEALLEAGQVQASRELWEELVEERPSTPDGWSGLLLVARHHHDAIPDRDALYRRILAQGAMPEVLADVALALHEEGRTTEAEGLLELAWLDAPGDRHLRRARKLVGLPTALLDTLPEHVLVDPTTGAPLEAPRRVPASGPPTLEAAEALGRTLAEERQSLVSLAATLPWRQAVPVLLLARDGALPDLDELDAAVHDLAMDLATLERGTDLRWLDPGQEQVLLARLREVPLDPDRLAAPEPEADDAAWAAWVDSLGLVAREGPRGPALQRY